MTTLTPRSVKLTDAEWTWLAERGRTLSPLKPLSYGETVRWLIERDRQQQSSSNGRAKERKR